MKRILVVALLVWILWGYFPVPPPVEATPMALDYDYVVYEAAMTAKPTAQWQQATNDLFVAWKAALGVNRLSEAFDVIYLFVAESEQAALLNAAKRDHDATNNSMAFTSRVGMEGDGVAAYIDTNYNPTADGVTYTLNDALIGIHLQTSTGGYPFGEVAMGASSSGSTVNTGITLVDQLMQFYINSFNSTGAASAGGYLYPPDFLLAQRYGAGARELDQYKNGIQANVVKDSVSVGVPDGSIFIGAVNDNGTASGYSQKQYGAAFIGRSLTATEHADFYAAWANYLAILATPAPPEYQYFFPIVGTNAVCQIFDKAGVPIGEILPDIDFASWRRNDIGQTTFSLAKSDPKANDTFLRAQNRILITFDNGLPPWGGIMQPDFVIDHNRINVKSFTGESLLMRRLTDRGRYFSQETIGGIATALITEANAVWPLGIDLGTVWAGGDRYSPEYHYKDLLTIFKESLFKRLSAADFYAEPLVGSDGRLTFSLYVSERRGRDVTGVGLHQGLNVVDPIKVGYTGPIVNSWTIVGDGQGWGTDRPVAVATDAASIERHGLLEDSEIHQGVVNVQTLQTTADNLLTETAWPRVILDITAVDLPPATFEQYDIGDNLPVELPDYGIGDSFVGAATVLARAFYPRDGRLNLVLEATESA